MGSGSLGRELDLEALVRALEDELGEELESKFQSSGIVTIRLGSDSPAYSIYRTGSFQIRGAENQRQLDEDVNRLIDVLSRVGVELSDVDFESRTAVYMTEVDQEVNLEALTISLGLENTEYEPEQFPGIVYRPPQLGATLLIFASGKVLIVGTTDKQTALEAFRIVETSINED